MRSLFLLFATLVLTVGTLRGSRAEQTGWPLNDLTEYSVVLCSSKSAHPIRAVQRGVLQLDRVPEQSTDADHHFTVRLHTERGTAQVREPQWEVSYAGTARVLVVGDGASFRIQLKTADGRGELECKGNMAAGMSLLGGHYSIHREGRVSDTGGVVGSVPTSGFGNPFEAIRRGPRGRHGFPTTLPTHPDYSGRSHRLRRVDDALFAAKRTGNRVTGTVSIVLPGSEGLVPLNVAGVYGRDDVIKFRARYQPGPDDDLTVRAELVYLKLADWLVGPYTITGTAAGLPVDERGFLWFSSWRPGPPPTLSERHQQ